METEEHCYDEKFMIWYSGQEENQLRLSSVTEVIRRQRTVNFQKQLQPDREAQSFSLIYADGKRSIDLIEKGDTGADIMALFSYCADRCRDVTAGFCCKFSVYINDIATEKV
ncbi:PH, RCC1 and FYVE domains-containing protein 1 [Eucalyptus grandis]|uniref:PH, RCC1 and FYVE domains-containing protein 1 n=1 Tax=Eucalyptus grandis TaxID=71139 RepID=UPI00192E9E72|nr:PH, RCC1 and FYVE domains-containing protein 1 [Eucalyptus grandis]